ncbi:MAG: flagellar hook-associated protein FlgL [Clostridia bacterium]|nr:flagellar hook-associated protein FlgL [Clostridia bacterium]
MAMRITNNMMTDSFQRNMQNNLQKMDKFTQQLATTRKIVRLSDDPVGVLDSLTARTRLSDIRRFQNNIKDAKTWTESADTCLQQISSHLTSVLEGVTQAATDIYNPSDRENIAQMMIGLRETIMEGLNTAVGGTYIFSGYNTNNPPFTKVDEASSTTPIRYNGLDLTDIGTLGYGITEDVGGNLSVVELNKAFSTTAPMMRVTIGADGQPTATTNGVPFTNASFHVTIADDGTKAVSTAVPTPSATVPTFAFTASGADVDMDYNGIDLRTFSTPDNQALILNEEQQQIQFQAGYDLGLDASMTGIEVVGVGEQNLFQIINDVIKLMENGSDADVAENLSHKIDDLQNAQQNITTCLVKVAATEVKISKLEDRYGSDEIDYTAIVSRIEDIDSAETIMQWKMAQAVYQQSLGVGAKVIQPTLLDFLN